MKFKRATALTTSQAAAASKVGSSTKAIAGEANTTVPKLSFEDIVANNKLELNRSDECDGVQQPPRSRQAFTVLSPNRAVLCQQKQKSGGQRDGLGSASPKRPRRSSLVSPPLFLRSPSAKGSSIVVEKAKVGLKRPTFIRGSVYLKPNDGVSSGTKHPTQMEERQESTEQETKQMETALPEVSEVSCEGASWEYPEVRLPSCNFQKRIYNATKIQPSSHQYQLSSVAKSGLLSLEDVIIPAICYHEERALRKCEKSIRQQCARIFDKAPINDSPVITRSEYIDQNSDVQIVIACRSLVKEFETVARLEVRKSRVGREAKITQQLQHFKKQSIIEEYKKMQEKLRIERAERRERQMKQKQADKEKRNKDRKKTFYKNKEIWREIALLMTALSRLEREEKEWISVQNQLNKREEELAVMSLNPASYKDQSSSMNSEVNNTGEEVVASTYMQSPDIEITLRQAMEDISLSTGRINQTLRDVLQFVEETEAVRKEIYHKYTNEHQFRGYLGTENPKGLVHDVMLNGF